MTIFREGEFLVYASKETGKPIAIFKVVESTNDLMICVYKQDFVLDDTWKIGEGYAFWKNTDDDETNIFKSFIEIRKLKKKEEDLIVIANL